MCNATLLKTALAVLADAEVTYKAAEAALKDAESVLVKAKIEFWIADRRECVAREKALSASARREEAVLCHEEAESVSAKAKIEFWIASDAARREEAVAKVDAEQS